ncbi:MAG: hypothetical protein GKR89_16435 [Candidatus Latescibacteria bacterium]|nr:hypothetical protein [Candidatus Latescibacterota bacterium]
MSLQPPHIPYDSGPDPRAKQKLPKLAALCSSYFPRSHSQHTVDRFLMGYEYDGQFHYPPFQIASLYVDQRHEDDLSRLRAEQYGCQIYPDIAAALTLGGDTLAVDGVLLVCENGDYPTDERGAILYPRYEFFREMVAVFDASGRSVPVFNDKHLSYDWTKARWMYEQLTKLNIPMLAGSSLPVTWRLPELEIPLETPLQEALAVYPGHVESYGIHALEMLQCMVERRRGGESGIQAVQYLEGAAVWRAAAEGRWSRPLLEAARSRRLPRQVVERQRTWSTVQLEAAYAAAPVPNLEPLEEQAKNPVALLVEYRDGLRAACINLNIPNQDFAFAAHRADGQIDSTLFFLGGPPESAYHGIQVHHIEELFTNGRANYPVERTLLTTGVLAFLMDSRQQGHQRLETPDLNISYQVTSASHFARGPMPLRCPWAPHGLFEPLARSLGLWPQKDTAG